VIVGIGQPDVGSIVKRAKDQAGEPISRRFRQLLRGWQPGRRLHQQVDAEVAGANTDAAFPALQLADQCGDLTFVAALGQDDTVGRPARRPEPRRRNS
jgi:hypothetical protein